MHICCRCARTRDLPKGTCQSCNHQGYCCIYCTSQVIEERWSYAVGGVYDHKFSTNVEGVNEEEEDEDEDVQRGRTKKISKWYGYGVHESSSDDDEYMEHKDLEDEDLPPPSPNTQDDNLSPKATQHPQKQIHKKHNTNKFNFWPIIVCTTFILLFTSRLELQNNHYREERIREMRAERRASRYNLEKEYERIGEGWRGVWIE